MHHFSLAGQSLRRADDFPSYFSLFAKKGLTTKLFDASKFTLTLEKTGSGKKHEGTGSTVSIEIFGDKSRGYFPSMGRNLSELGNLKSVRVRINGTGKGGKFLELVPNARLHYDDQFEDPNLPGTMITPVELREPSCFFSGGLGGAGGLLS